MKAYKGKLFDVIAFTFKALFVVSLAVVVFGCASTSAPTGTLAWFENEAGGHVMLTNEPCHVEENKDELYRAVAVGGERQVDGCWIAHDEKEVIETHWWDSEKREWVTRHYEKKEFTPTELGRSVPVKHLKP